jgi:hypothetical protein
MFCKYLDLLRNDITILLRGNLLLDATFCKQNEYAIVLPDLEMLGCMFVDWHRRLYWSFRLGQEMRCSSVKGDILTAMRIVALRGGPLTWPEGGGGSGLSRMVAKFI